MGFIGDPKVAPTDSMISFMNSNLMAEIVKKFKIPIGEEMAMGMRNLCDTIYAMRYVKADESRGVPC